MIFGPFYIQYMKSFSKAYIKATTQEKISAIAVPGNNTDFAVVHVPRTWNGKRCWVMTQDCYDNMRGKQNLTQPFFKLKLEYTKYTSQSLQLGTSLLPRLFHPMLMNIELLFAVLS